MSNSDDIIKILELEDVQLIKIETDENTHSIFVEVPRRDHECPHCHTLTREIHDYRWQRILDVPLASKQTYLIYRKRRYRCPDCGKRFFEKNTFLPRYAHTTNRLFLRISQLLHSVHSQKSIAQQLFTSSMRVHRILDSLIPSLPVLPRVLGIDEFRGNTNKTKYHCILTDIESGLPIDILSNRTEASLIQHFRKYQYTQQLKNVEIIVIDMWLPYFTVLREIFPQATIVIDRFHMVRQAMWALEGVRKRIQKQMPDTLRMYFKRSRTILLKRSDRLIVNDYVDEVRQRDRMLQFFPDLAQAYWLKEEILRMVSDIHDLPNARTALDQWIQKAKASRIPEMKNAIRAYQNWRKPILNSFSCPYSNGVTEGCNNKIKVIKRNAFGLRNFDRFRTRILLSFQ